MRAEQVHLQSHLIWQDARTVRARAQRQRRDARDSRVRARRQVVRSIDGWLACRGLAPAATMLPPDEVLDLVVRGAHDLFPGCRSVGLTVAAQIGDEQCPWATVAATGVAETVDAAQYRLGEGPCVEAVELDMVAVVQADDLAAEHDRRIWPHFGRAAVELGVRSAMSVAVPWSPFRVGLHPERRALAAINLYASGPHAFDHAERRGMVLGAWAVAAVTDRDLAEFLDEID